MANNGARLCLRRRRGLVLRHLGRPRHPAGDRLLGERDPGRPSDRAGGRPSGLREHRRHRPQLRRSRRRPQPRSRRCPARVPACGAGLPRRVVRQRRRPPAPRLPSAGQRPPVPHRPVGGGHRSPSPGQEILEGSASMDLNAFTAGGYRASGLAQALLRLDHRQPNDRHASARSTPTRRAHKVVIGLDSLRLHQRLQRPRRRPARRRRGRAFTTTTPTPATTARRRRCPGCRSPPGVARRPSRSRRPATTCSAARPVATRSPPSDHPITATDFAGATPLTGAPAPKARRRRSRPTRPRPRRSAIVAIRAVDDQGNVGRPLVVDLRRQAVSQRFGLETIIVSSCSSVIPASRSVGIT